MKIKLLSIIAHVLISVIALASIVHVLVLSQKMNFDNDYELISSCEKPIHYPRLISVVSLNLWDRLGTVDASLRFHKFSQTILKEDPDILVLQEVFKFKSIEILEQELGTLYPYRILPKQTGYPNIVNWIHSGLAIYSKYPIISWEAEIWDTTNVLESYSSKGVLRVDVQYGVDIFSIFDLHMVADMKNKKYQDLRAKQFIQLRQFISKSPYPKLVIGDFNTELHVIQKFLNEELRIDEETYDQITINHTRNPYSDRICGGKGRKKTIDFILSCDQIEFNHYCIDEKNFFSDHARILARISLDIDNKIRGPD